MLSTYFSSKFFAMLHKTTIAIKNHRRFSFNKRGSKFMENLLFACDQNRKKTLKCNLIVVTNCRAIQVSFLWLHFTIVSDFILEVYLMDHKAEPIKNSVASCCRSNRAREINEISFLYLADVLGKRKILNYIANSLDGRFWRVRQKTGNVKWHFGNRIMETFEALHEVITSNNNKHFFLHSTRKRRQILVIVFIC